MAENKSQWDITEKADENRIGGGVGASDGSSGGGNATGSPDAETGMRAEDVVNRGNVEEDRKKLFPNEGSGEERGVNEGSLKAHGDKLEAHLREG